MRYWQLLGPGESGSNHIEGTAGMCSVVQPHPTGGKSVSVSVSSVALAVA